ncbi:MAG: TonB-dependent receptor [Balneolales bacterium]
MKIIIYFMDQISRSLIRDRFKWIPIFSFIAWGILFPLSHMALGQATSYGTVYGEVNDLSTGEVLPGANVIVEGTTIGVATDVDGRYTLRRVPVGNITVEFSYLGYVSKEVEVSVEENLRHEINVDLESAFVEGGELSITAQQRGQSRALTIQRQSVNIRSVVSSEQMDQFADVNVAAALQRIAGMGHGGTNIRGVGAGSANITMDGQRMGSTGADRSVDVSTISSDMVQQLEVIKVITPDMDADALSGTINISTRRPVGGQRTMNVRLGGGYNPRFVDDVGSSGRVSFSYGDSPTDKFSYGVNLSYQRSANASEHVRTDWGWSNFAQIEGPSDILTGLRNGITYDPRDRLAGGFQLTLQPNDRTTFYVMTNVNYEHRLEEQHINRWSFREFFSPVETRGFDDPGRAGDMLYEASLNESDIHQYTARVGARHLFNEFEMEYKVGWGYGLNNTELFAPEYSTLKAFENLISFERGNHYPTLEILPTSLIKDFPERSDYYNRTFNEEISWNFHKNNDFSGTLDFNIPLSMGTLKFGSSAMMAFMEGTSERFLLRYQRQVYLDNFDPYLGRDFQVFDRPHETYRMPFIMDVHRMREFNKTYRPHFEMDLEAWAVTAETGYYDAQEQTYAGYGMGAFDLWRFQLLGGMRVEHSSSRYAGRAGVISEEQNFQGAVDTLASNNYTHFFPNAQLIYSLGKLTNIRLAWSRSIGRPTLTQLSPYVLWDHSSERISEGNPKLNPMISDNLDMLFEHYFMNVGQFTVGLFYKFMNDFIFNYTEIIGPEGVDGDGLYARWRRSTLLNGDDADVYGAEVSWQQNLTFLPFFLSNMGIYSNYSYSMSDADINRPGETVRLQGQRPHVVNAGLDYTQNKFSGQISYAWGSPSISSYGSLDFASSLYGDSKRVYMDHYRDAANNLSMTIQYRLTDEFRIWADADNILNHKSIDYIYNREVYPRTQNLSGRTMNMGLRYTF